MGGGGGGGLTEGWGWFPSRISILIKDNAVMTNLRNASITLLISRYYHVLCHSFSKSNVTCH